MIPIKTTNYHPLVVVCAMVSVLFLASCTNQSQDSETQEPAQSMVEVEPHEIGLVEVKAVGLTLEAEDEIPSGWTTFRFINDSDMIHFAYLYKVPPGIGIDDHKEMAPVFQNFMDQINGRPLSDPDAGMEIPEWFGQIVTFGGPGLLSKRKTSETTVFIEPGIYLIECYVKTDGIFHSYNSSPTETGMVHQFVVTDENNGASEPEATLDISLSGDGGMTISGEASTGSHVVGVTFMDQKPHENFQGHDVHLVRLDQDSDLAQIEQWVDWRNPTGLQTPSPAEFLGGTNELPAGGKAYFSVDLKPGRYAWIAEVPNAQEKGMLVEFEVSDNL